MKYIYVMDSISKGIELTSDAMRKAGFTVVDKHYFLHHFFRVKYVSLNWYENFDPNRVYSHFIKKLVFFLILKATNKKLLWTVHNKIPHDSNKVKLSLFIMKLLISQVNIMIIFCDETISVLKNISPHAQFEQKIAKIPHPNYVGSYPCDGTVSFKITGDTGCLKLLFIGMIREYKNVDLLIAAISELKNEHIHLTIAGSCPDEQYKAKLTQMAGDNTHITLYTQYVNDDEIVALMRQHDILILPYDVKSTLNSGAILLAFSNKKTVIAPLIGTLKEYPDRSFFYVYDYTSSDEHKQRLKESIVKVLADMEQHPAILQEKGDIAFDLVKTNNSPEILVDFFKDI